MTTTFTVSLGAYFYISTACATAVAFGRTARMRGMPGWLAFIFGLFCGVFWPGAWPVVFAYERYNFK